MKALVTTGEVNGLGKRCAMPPSATPPMPSAEWTPSPSAEPICTFLRGDVPEVTAGRILAHEAVGWVNASEITGRRFEFGPEPDHAVVYD